MSLEKEARMAAAKDPIKRSAELDLEEEIIRDNYMYGVTNPRVVLSIVERLNEIQVEREFIQRRMKQDKEFALKKKVEKSQPASHSSSHRKPAHNITQKKGAPNHGHKRPSTIQLFFILALLSIIIFALIR